MNAMQEINLAYEWNELIESGWTAEEAKEEIKAVIETEYKADILAEVDEDILYFYDDVISDVLASIEALLERMSNSMALC